MESVTAAHNLTKDYAQGLLALHATIVSSDLRDPRVIGELQALVASEKDILVALSDQLKQRIRNIQAVVLHHYTIGAAAIEDWLN